MAESNCRLCVYFADMDKIGQCRRYPRFVTKHENEWCGEFRKDPPETVRQARKTLKLLKNDNVQAA